MSHNRQITNRDMEHTNEEDFLNKMPIEDRELFKRAISEAIDGKLYEIGKEAETMEMAPPSRRHMIRMNRLFRERVGGSFLPFPEKDTWYEKMRSKLIVKLKINEFLDRRKEKRRGNRKKHR